MNRRSASVTRAEADRPAVLVSGASTGIGTASTLHLASLGFKVFAGVRTEADAAALRDLAAAELTPLFLELRDESSIARAATEVGAAMGRRGLAGLVNNAGVVKPAPVEFQSLGDVREQLEVNLVGQIAVTQAFLPLIRLGGGRIVNVGSIGGRLALPLHGAYSASKFGMEALTDALRLELRQWRIPVSLIDPGPTESAIFGKTLAELDELERTLTPDSRSLYGAQIAALRRMVARAAEEAVPAADVATTIAHALTSRRPRRRYLAGAGARRAAAVARLMPDWAKDRAIAREVRLPPPEAS